MNISQHRYNQLYNLLNRIRYMNMNNQRQCELVKKIQNRLQLDLDARKHNAQLHWFQNQ